MSRQLTDLLIIPRIGLAFWLQKAHGQI